MKTASRRLVLALPLSLVSAAGASLVLLAGALGGGCVVPVSSSPGTGTTGASGTPGTSGASSGTAGTSGTTGTSGTSAAVEAGTATSGSSSGGDGAAPSGTWTNATGNLAGIMSECGNLSVVSAKPDEDLLIASVSLNGLYGSRNGGQSWQSLGTGTGSASITNRGQVVVYDSSNSMRWWECGIYNGNGVYETMDDGVTFTALGNEPPGDDVSIDFTDPNRQTLVAGGHESSMLLNLSTNGGTTWSSIIAGLPANTNCTNPLVIDSMTFLVGCGGYGGGPSGIWRTADQGTTWTNVTTSGGADEPLLASDGSIYWVGPSGNSMVRSTDKGVTWTTLISSGGVVNAAHPIELPNHDIALTGPSTLMVSADQGMTWTAASTMLPYTDSVGLTYSAQEKAFYIWHFTCGFNMPIPVPSDGVMRYAADYTQ